MVPGVGLGYGGRLGFERAALTVAGLDAEVIAVVEPHDQAVIARTGHVQDSLQGVAAGVGMHGIEFDPGLHRALIGVKHRRGQGDVFRVAGRVGVGRGVRELFQLGPGRRDLHAHRQVGQVHAQSRSGGHGLGGI